MLGAAPRITIEAATRASPRNYSSSSTTPGLGHVGESRSGVGLQRAPRRGRFPIVAQTTSNRNRTAASRGSAHNAEIARKRRTRTRLGKKKRSRVTICRIGRMDARCFGSCGTKSERAATRRVRAELSAEIGYRLNAGTGRPKQRASARVRAPPARLPSSRRARRAGPRRRPLQGERTGAHWMRYDYESKLRVVTSPNRLQCSFMRPSSGASPAGDNYALLLVEPRSDQTRPLRLRLGASR